MPNRRSDYPHYEEAILIKDANVAIETSQLLDAMVSRREMRKFVSMLSDEELDAWEARQDRVKE